MDRRAIGHGPRRRNELVETTVTEPSLRELLDALVATSQYIAETVSRRTGRPVVEYVPSTRAYAPVTFAVGGAALVTGAVFFILAGVEDAKLTSNTSLPDAVSARNAGKTDVIVGSSLTALGIVGVVAGLFLFNAGAKPPVPAVSLSVDPSRGMVLIGGPLP